jgi:hypothetical protein
VEAHTISSNEWVPAIYGKNAGAGDGVYGWSQERHGTYGVTKSPNPNHAGVYGINQGSGPGVHGETSSSNGYGVYGVAHSSGSSERNYGGYFMAAGGFGAGVCGEASGTQGSGVLGISTNSSYGVSALSREDLGKGVGGFAHYVGGHFEAADSNGYGVVAIGGPYEFYGDVEGVGVVGIGGTYDFYAAGPGEDYGSASSIRWKSDVRLIDNPLGKVMNLRGVYFNWDAEHGGKHDVGMIAEEVGEVLPEIVQYEEDGIYTSGMDYSKLTPLLVEAVKTLKKENDELQEQNKRLESRLSALEKAMRKGSLIGKSL